MALPSLCPRCEELEDQVAALKGTAGFYWALWQEVQHLLAHLPRPGRRGSPYAIWYDGPRADALRGHHPDFARRLCPTCRTAVLSLFRLPRRYGDTRPVCAACYESPLPGVRLDSLLVAEANRVVRVFAKRGNSFKPFLLIEANSGVLVNPCFKAEYVNAAALRVSLQMVEHQLPETSTAELGPHVHAFDVVARTGIPSSSRSAACAMRATSATGACATRVPSGATPSCPGDTTE
jgi:hypothetical protein